MLTPSDDTTARVFAPGIGWYAQQPDRMWAPLSDVVHPEYAGRALSHPQLMAVLEAAWTKKPASTCCVTREALGYCGCARRQEGAAAMQAQLEAERAAQAQRALPGSAYDAGRAAHASGHRIDEMPAEYAGNAPDVLQFQHGWYDAQVAEAQALAPVPARTAHTPGPYHYVQSSDARLDGFIRRTEDVYVPGRVAIGRVCKGGGRSAFEVNSNGHLFAGAPELLAACKAVLAGTSEELPAKLRAQLRGAIAKAEGK